MPTFRCTFVNLDGRFNKREIQASSRKNLLANLSGSDEKILKCRRLFLQDLSLKSLLKRKTGYNDFLRFNQELVSLLRSGMPLIHSLEVIEENIHPGPLKNILQKTISNIHSGTQVSEAFRHSQLPLSKIYYASLLAGEKSGNIEGVLDRFSVFIDKMSSLRRKTISSLTYPAVLFGFMGILFTVITVVIIPRFSSLYENFEAQLPGLTIFFLEATQYLKDNFMIFAGMFVFFYIGIRLIEHFNPKIILIDKYKLHIPFIGRAITENSLAVFARTLSILISGGIPVPEATATATETISNRFLFNRFAPITPQIREGRDLSSILAEEPIIPKIFIEMIKVGETSGNLSRVLDECADFYEHSIDSRINTLISLIEPVIIIIMGVVVAIMLLSVYLPIFSSIQIVQ